MVSTAVAMAGVSAYRQIGERRAARAAVRHGDLLRMPRDHRRARALPQLPDGLPAGHGGAHRCLTAISTSWWWARVRRAWPRRAAPRGVRQARGDAGRQSAARRADLARRREGSGASGCGPRRARRRRGWPARACSMRPRRGTLAVETFEGECRVGYRSLILATGARERFLPFPGWTLPNVMGAGGLQALAKSGLPMAGKRVVIAGSGPLLLAVAQLHARARRRCPADCGAGAAIRAAALRAAAGAPSRESWCRRWRCARACSACRI